MAFTGTFTPRLDEKGRIILPAKYRELFADGIVVTKGHERCLAVYTKEEFDRKVEAKRAVHSDETKDGRFYMRNYLSSVSEENMDRQGRVTIPPALRTYAQLDRECTVIGVWDCLEIWSSELWAQNAELLDEQFVDAT